MSTVRRAPRHPGASGSGLAGAWVHPPMIGFETVTTARVGEPGQRVECPAHDVSDPFQPREMGSVRVGGIVDRKAYPARPDQPLAGGPQMVEVSRDSKRVYFTNSLYGSWDDQFYPDGVGAWMAKLDVSEDGSISFDERFFVEGDAFRGRRPHQVRLQGGDASSDSYCYPSD